MDKSVERCDQIKMYSWDSIEPAILRGSGEITNAFLQLGVSDLRHAARFIQSLRYGRNAHPDRRLVVLDERIGTCSTKHALMYRLAIEQNVAMALTIGIYEMSERNTPGVGVVLARFGIRSLPEAHCYIRFRGKRIDLTGIPASPEMEPIVHFLFETDIEAGQILDYKVKIHRQFLESWNDRQRPQRSTIQELWSIREECIAALSNRASRSADRPSSRDSL